MVRCLVPSGGGSGQGWGRLCGWAAGGSSCQWQFDTDLMSSVHFHPPPHDVACTCAF